MARYFAEIQGQSGEATRLGSVTSGIRAHVRGWNLGVKVYGAPFMDGDDRDAFAVYITGGSHDTNALLHLGTVVECEGSLIEFHRSSDQGGSRIRVV